MLRHTYLLLLLVLLSGLGCPPALAEDAVMQIEDALTRWMADFNAGRADKVCELFAPDLRADFRGQPERDHDGLCDLLTRSLTDKDKTFAYALAIKEIKVFGDAAVVRLVWTLTVKEKDGEETKSVEPGMDIFQKQADGTWKIIRYMAYEQ
jgi:uncharacterized protein (TIGR02246 family)